MQASGYVPPPVRAPGSGAPSYWETMTYTLVEIAGVPLRVHAIFPIFLAVKTFVGLFYYGFTFSVLTFILDGPILFVSVLIHELAHCAVARHYGAEITHISLWPLGGLSYTGHRADVKEDVAIALAGPLSHIAQGLFWLVLGAEQIPVSSLTTTPTGQTAVASSDYSAVMDNFWLQLCSFALLVQFLLFWLNMTLPVYPLDGGRLLVAGLSHLGVNLESAGYIVAGSGIAAGGFIFLYGLLASATTAAFGAWACYEAFALRQRVKAGETDMHPLFSHYMGGPPAGAMAGMGGGPGMMAGYGMPGAPMQGAFAQGDKPPGGAMYGAL